MEPNTASKLRERKSNKLKDFIAMAGPLGVSHLLVLSQSTASGVLSNKETSPEDEAHVTLKIARLPRGPTLSFRVMRYALMRDVLNACKKPHSPGKEFQSEPLLILNNFSNHQNERQVQLTAQAFQGLFPSIKVHEVRSCSKIFYHTVHPAHWPFQMALTSARRIVLLSYDPITRTIQFRHYLISIRALGVTRNIRKIVEGASTSTGLRRKKALPNLSAASDISDYVLAQFGREGSVDSGAFSDAGTTTDGESEAETDISADEAEGKESRKVVRLPSQYLGRNNPANSKRAVRLTELGPRLELGLVKIDSGMAVGGESTKDAGEVLFHEFVKKSQKEVDEMRRKQNLKDQRRKEQEANVRRKQKEQEEKNGGKQKEDGKKDSKVAFAEPKESAKDEGDQDEVESVEDDDEMLDEVDDEEDSDLEPIPFHEAEDEEASSDDEEAPPVKKPRSISTRQPASIKSSKRQQNPKAVVKKAPRRGQTFGKSSRR